MLIAYKLLLFAQSFEVAAVATVVLLLSYCGVALADIFENCLVVRLKKTACCSQLLKFVSDNIEFGGRSEL